MEAIVAAVIGAIGTILSAVVLIRPRWGGETPADSPRISNPAVRLTTVLSAGSSLTLILILIVVSVGPLQSDQTDILYQCQ